MRNIHAAVGGASSDLTGYLDMVSQFADSFTGKVFYITVVTVDLCAKAKRCLRGGYEATSSLW